MHDQPMTRPGSARRRAPAFLLLAAFAALTFSACGASTSPLPSVNLQTLDADATPVAGCVDPATKAVLDQLTAADADVPALLAENSDVLIAGLNTLQPADEATTTWRDDLVAALEDGDMEAAAAQIEELASGGVTLTAC